MFVEQVHVQLVYCTQTMPCWIFIILSAKFCSKQNIMLMYKCMWYYWLCSAKLKCTEVRKRQVIDFVTLKKFQRLQFTRHAGLSHRHTCIDFPSSRAYALWSWRYVVLEVRWTFLEPGCQQSPLHSCQRLPDQWKKWACAVNFRWAKISLTTWSKNDHGAFDRVKAISSINGRFNMISSSHSKICFLRPPLGATKSGGKQKVVFQHRVTPLNIHTCPLKSWHGVQIFLPKQADMADSLEKKTLFWEPFNPCIYNRKIESERASGQGKCRKTVVKSRWMNQHEQNFSCLWSHSPGGCSTQVNSVQNHLCMKIWSRGPAGRWMQRP